jgi:cytochrome c556
MSYQFLLRDIFAAAILAVSITSNGLHASEVENSKEEPLVLRQIMIALGKDMQTVTDAISREDWVRVAETASIIADHPQPPFTEKVRILAFVGSDAGRFKQFDKQTHQAATIMEQAAKRGDGQAVIEYFATLQNSCLACHQNYRKPFVEHFYVHH